jgi:hypothetical protein
MERLARTIAIWAASVHKTYSADQLAALSKLSSDMILKFAQLGLLDERGGGFGFRDLASARQIAKLLAENGYPRSRSEEVCLREKGGLYRHFVHFWL